MMPASKPALAGAIWALIPRDVVGPTGQSRYILYGGSMVHRIPWQRDTTYNDTCRQNTKYVTRKCRHSIIVFDGYQEGLSTKYGAHERRTCRRADPTVDFTQDMVMTSKKETYYPTRGQDYKEIWSMDWCSTHDSVLNKQKTHKW